jgi:hypothetical protein
MPFHLPRMAFNLILFHNIFIFIAFNLSLFCNIFNFTTTLLDIFHPTPQSSQRLIPITFDNPCVASVAALRETKMSSSVLYDF